MDHYKICFMDQRMTLVQSFYKVDHTQMVELIVPAGTAGFGTRIPFQNQPQLQTISNDRQIWLKAIMAFSNDTIAGSPITSQSPAASAADILNAVLVLKSLGEDRYNQVPLSRLCNVQSVSLTPWNLEPFRFRNALNVDWQKSYIQILTPPAGVLPYSYLFSVDYQYTPDPDDVSSMEEFVQFRELQRRITR